MTAPICPVCQVQHAPGPCPAPDVSPRPPDRPAVSRNYVEGECVATGDLHAEDLAWLAGQPCLVILATREELRGGPAMIYERVEVAPVRRPAPLVPDTPAVSIPQCECEQCCNGDHAGRCVECGGWAQYEGDRCGHCEGTGICPVCDGAREPAAKSLPPCPLCGATCRTWDWNGRLQHSCGNARCGLFDATCDGEEWHVLAAGPSYRRAETQAAVDAAEEARK